MHTYGLGTSEEGSSGCFRFWEFIASVGELDGGVETPVIPYQESFTTF